MFPGAYLANYSPVKTGARRRFFYQDTINVIRIPLFVKAWTQQNYGVMEIHTEIHGTAFADIIDLFLFETRNPLRSGNLQKFFNSSDSASRKKGQEALKELGGHIGIAEGIMGLAHINTISFDQ